MARKNRQIQAGRHIRSRGISGRRKRNLPRLFLLGIILLTVELELYNMGIVLYNSNYKHMTLKQFRAIQLALVMVLAGLVGWATVRQNYVITIMATAVTVVFLFYLQNKVKEIMADERDYEIGGKAARLAITVFCWIMIVIMFAFLAFRGQNPEFEMIAVALGYSICLLMVLYSFFFRYYDKVAFLERKFIYILVGVLLVLLLAIAGIRLISGEDNWLCRDGQWIKHGNPSAPMPSIECEK